MWVLQIIVNNIVKAHPLLNTLFIALDDAFALLGVIAYSIFAFYLLWASVKGCVKIGMRIVFFTIHPMKLGDTMMNALLFNVGLILITSITVVQFCSQSFSTYAVNTAVDMLIGLYVRRLVGIGDIIYYFQYALLATIGLSVLWILLCPRKKPPKDKKGDLLM
jgi:LMBR1 domain-containing protein 1